MATIDSAAQTPIAKGRSNAHRLLISNPATSASDRTRMIVMQRDCHEITTLSMAECERTVFNEILDQ